jgi:nucleotide-binding universal stress UspA family protein
MQDLKKILFPTDFSRNADRALLQGLRLSGFDCGELIIQHVVRDYFAEHRHFVAMFGIHELQTEMDGYIETHVIPALGSSAKNIRITKVFSKGEPSAEIASLANKEFVDLVLMASADGVFTNAVIRQTHRPVLVASLRGLPEGRSLKKIQRILVATDFSRNSRQVTRYAFALKNLYDSELCMLHVLEAPALPEFVFTRRAADESMNRALDLAGKRLVSMTPDDYINDPTVTRRVEFGTASDTIAAVANEIAADITIVGAHPYGTFRRKLATTTTDDLISKAASPLLAVPVLME